MKNYYIYILLLGQVAFSQVGINTTTPQQEVHVAGATENVIVDGLNTSNHASNLGMLNTTKVYVDADGDLTLASSSRNVEILFDSENYLVDAPTPDNLVNQTGGGFGYTVAGIPLAGIVGSSFTLTKPAIIEVNYSVSWQVYKTASASGRIADVHARIIQTGIFFRETATLAPVLTDVLGNFINDGPWCVDVNAGGTVCNEVGGMLGINGQFYNNSDSKNGEYANYHNTASDYVRLNPGTYTAFFAAQLAVGDTGGTGAVKMHLGTGNDDLQIIAHYYD